MNTYIYIYIVDYHETPMTNKRNHNPNTCSLLGLHYSFENTKSYPNAPCMEYLSTVTPKIAGMELNIL